MKCTFSFNKMTFLTVVYKVIAGIEVVRRQNIKMNPMRIIFMSRYSKMKKWSISLNRMSYRVIVRKAAMGILKSNKRILIMSIHKRSILRIKFLLNQAIRSLLKK